MAIAREALGWGNVFVDGNGNVRGQSPRTLSELPLTLDIPITPQLVAILESRTSFADKRKAYVRKIRQLTGKGPSFASPRLRCEVMLQVYRDAAASAE